MTITSLAVLLVLAAPQNTSTQISTTTSRPLAPQQWHPATVELVGMFLKEASGRWRYEVLLDSADRGIPLAINTQMTLRDKHALDLRVVQQSITNVNVTREYRVVVSPDLSNAGELKVVRDGVQIIAGWGYFAGHMPYGETTRTTAAADGFGFFIAVNGAGGGAYDEVAYVVANPGAVKPVTVRKGADTGEIQQVGWYRRVDANAIGQPQQTNQNRPLTGKIEQARLRAREAEIE